MDDQTIQAARLGNRLARTGLLLELQDPWYRLCLSLLRDPDLARDAVQETALRFLRNLPEFSGQSQIKTWSFGIAINVVREIRRQRRFDPDVDLIEAETTSAGPIASAVETEQRSVLHAVLADLPQRQREAIVLRFFEELSVEQTAAAMQCAEGTVKATVHQALRELRRRLKQLT